MKEKLKLLGECVVNVMLIWRKRRIEKYVQEFKDENPKHKKYVTS